MKKAILLGIIILLAVSNAIGQHKKVLALEAFDKVQIDGNIRLYLEQGAEAIVGLEVKKEQYFDDYKIVVRHNTLYVTLRDKPVNTAPKLKMYLTHPALKGIDIDGLVHVNSVDPVTGESFYIKGDGYIRGTVAVDVQKLGVDLDGFCSMSFSGKADISDFRLDGMGRINARELETSEVYKRAEGLASIKGPTY